MIFNLTKFLDEKSQKSDFFWYDFIINIWVCWFKKNWELKIENWKIKDDFIQIWRIFNLTTKKEILVPIFFEFWPIKSIACSENIVYEKNVLWEENYVDMESFAVEFVADKFKIPRIILKVPVDEVWDETKNFDFEKALKLLEGNIDYKLLIEKIREYLK